MYRARWALAWALLILVLCLMPGSELPAWSWVDILDLDKAIHAFLFFVLTILIAQVFRTRGRPGRWALWAFLLSALFGVATEYMQGLEALGRRTDPLDMLANAAGALLAIPYCHYRVRNGKEPLPFAWMR